jgi:hypothetical protein
MIGNVIAETPFELGRIGKFTASRIDDLFSEPKLKADKEAGKLSDTAMKYVYEKLSEITTGTVRKMDNWSLEWGNNWEPVAAGKILESFPDFVYLGKENPEFFPYSDFSGGSPDGHHNNGRVVDEIKCPENPAIHIAYCMIENNEQLRKASKDYYHQIQMNMACVAKKFGYKFDEMRGLFTSYCPLINQPYKDVHHVEIFPDMEFYKKLPVVIQKAEEMLAEILSRMDKSHVVIVSYDPEVKAMIAEPIDHKPSLL